MGCSRPRRNPETLVMEGLLRERRPAPPGARSRAPWLKGNSQALLARRDLPGPEDW
jgi:hypothetical protein